MSRFFLFLVYFAIVSFYFVSCAPTPSLNNKFDPISETYRELRLLECALQLDSNCLSTYQLSGTITGLISGTSLKLKLNGGQNSSPISNNGSFSITTKGGSLSADLEIGEHPAQLYCTVEHQGTNSESGKNDVIVSCPMARLETEGKQILWTRCAYGQVWNPNGSNGAGDCKGTGTSATEYGLNYSLNFCSNPIGDCNGGSGLAGGPLLPPPWLNSSTSQVYSACEGLNLSKKFGRSNWRVPNIMELKQIVYCSNGPNPPLANFIQCNGGSTMPTINTSLFPDTTVTQGGAPYAGYWSATSYSVDYAQSFQVSFRTGETTTPDQDQSFSVRCVSTL
ncbi:DUF1566 domain-containing protein [Leptospira idonii]|uniref:DUF1566 domain-containing protein n=1 Tax=Leptospira idonii TaxID=1193500 RepID=A0A4R9LZ30_9LEPT|nr:DUF1566 domain-containing protein [Leptospira idonii]TGN18992.1 DUF1566 domain-containing protein [Leptospira idonii]